MDDSDGPTDDLFESIFSMMFIRRSLSPFKTNTDAIHSMPIADIRCPNGLLGRMDAQYIDNIHTHGLGG